LAENAGMLCGKILNEANRRNLPMISGVRGLGLMIGFQIDPDAVAGAGGFTGESRAASVIVVEALAEAGLLTVPAGSDVVRWLPPLVVTQAEVDEAFEIMEKVLNKLIE
jgi:acetylornithine/N-succinyldiaminopimelate aminotransferase